MIDAAVFCDKCGVFIRRRNRDENPANIVASGPHECTDCRARDGSGKVAWVAPHGPKDHDAPRVRFSQ